MKRFGFLFSLFALVGIAHAQPVINNGGVLNGASYIPSSLPNGGIAQGSIFVIKGGNLGPAQVVSTSMPFPTTLSGVSVNVTVGSTTSKAYMIYSVPAANGNPAQLAALLPSSTPVGAGTITVSYNGQTSAAMPIQVVANNFGIFTLNQAGSGAGIFTNASFKDANNIDTVVTLTTAAQPGDTLLIWGTGLGPVTGDEASVPLPGNMTNLPVEVYVGGKLATLTYRGRSGCCGGEDQIAFIVPAGVTGCSVPVYVKIGNTVSNFVTIAVAATGRACSDPTGFTPGELITLQEKGIVSLGAVSLTRSNLTLSLPAPIGNATISTDTGSAIFERYNFAQYTTAQNPFSVTTIGSCYVATFAGLTGTVVDPVKPVVLDAGPTVNVQGPAGTKPMNKDASGFYNATLGGGGFPGLPGGAPAFLNAGTYTVDNGTGGSDVGPFKASFNLANPLVWTNQDSISSVTRSQGATVTWSGGDAANSVQIIGYSATGSGNSAVGASFVCTERISAGQFTVPPAVLQALPVSTVAGDVPTGALIVQTSTTPQKFTARGLDTAFLIGTVSNLKNVSYK